MWQDLTSVATGGGPSPRAGCVFAAVGDQLYLYGGWMMSGAPPRPPARDSPLAPRPC